MIKLFSQKVEAKKQGLIDDTEKFKLALDAASDQVVITDSEGIVLYGNRAIKRITGFEPEEALGKKAAALWKIPMPKKYYEDMWRTIKFEKKVFKSEIQNRRKNGEIYTADISISPILDKDGQIIYFIAIEHDVTERKNAEDQIRKVLNDMQEQAQTLTISKAKDEAILAGIGDGVFSTNQDGVITVINDAALKMIGYTKEEVIGQAVINIFKAVGENGKEVPLNRRPIVMALSTGEKISTPISNAYYYFRKDGSKFPAGITVTPFLFNGKIVGTIEVFRDITSEKTVDREKTEFVSLASHQLKTPIGAIQWNMEMILDGDYGAVPDNQKEVLEEVYTMSTRMNDLVNALLNISRIEMGVFIIEPTPTDFVKLCEEVLSEMELRRLKKGHELTRAFEKDLPIIMADFKLLRVVFQNFISNAIKYTSSKGKIRVELKKEDNNVVFSVANNGEPIPEAEQKKIFSKMFRASNAQEQDPDGNGLGLYMVKQIVENAGGKVWFSSKKGETVFACSFPLTGMIAKAGTKKLD